jgi:hypothetical protein
MFGIIPEWAVGVAFIMLAISVGKLLSGRGAPPDSRRVRKASWRDLARAMEDVERRLGELEEAQRRLGEGAGEDVQRRLSEIEERLDFTERMLAKQRDPERLDSPKH